MVWQTVEGSAPSGCVYRPFTFLHPTVHPRPLGYTHRGCAVKALDGRIVSCAARGLLLAIVG